MSKKIKFEIKNRFTGAVLFEYESEDNTLKKTLEEAVESDADLSDADLSDANLRGANLSDADLRGADLSDADLSDANLRGATIYYSDNNFDEENRKDRFMYKTQLESVETEMQHDVKSANNFWACTWHNVLKIKNWELKASGKQKEEAAAEPAKTESSRSGDGGFYLVVRAKGLDYNTFLALKQSLEERIPVANNVEATVIYGKNKRCVER